MIPRYKIFTALTDGNEAVAVVKFQFEFELVIGPDLLPVMKEQVIESLQVAVNNKPSATADFAFVTQLLAVIEETTQIMSTLRANAVELGGQALDDFKKLARTYERDWAFADADVSFDAVSAIHRSCTQFQAARMEIDAKSFSADIIYSAGLTQYRERVTIDNANEKIAQIDLLSQRFLAADPNLKGGKPKAPGRRVDILTALQLLKELYVIARDDVLPHLKAAHEKWQADQAAAKAQAERDAADRAYRAEKERVRDAAEKGDYYREQRGKDLYIT